MSVGFTEDVVPVVGFVCGDRRWSGARAAVHGFSSTSPVFYALARPSYVVDAIVRAGGPTPAIAPVPDGSPDEVPGRRA